MKIIRFEDRNDIELGIIEKLIGRLLPIDPNNSQKEKNFFKNGVVIKNKEEFIEKFFNEIDYQDAIAKKALTIFGGPERGNIVNYYWTIEPQKGESNLSKEKYIEVNLHLESNDVNQGDIIFPFEIALAVDNSFRIWEVASIEDAIDSIGQLHVP